MTQEKKKGVKSIHTYFFLYKRLTNELHRYEDNRRDTFGIAVAKDYWSVRWQAKQMSLEILTAKLENRNPNWYLARYLSNEEAERRNNSYNKNN